MKRIITALGLTLLIFGPIACGKHDIGTTLALLRHKWNIVSINGEAFRYIGQPGDYYDFRADSRLYIHSANLYDTLVYKVIKGGTTLQVYYIQNGIRLDVPAELGIAKLTSTSCIIRNCNTHPFCSLDSLSR